MIFDHEVGKVSSMTPMSSYRAREFRQHPSAVAGLPYHPGLLRPVPWYSPRVLWRALRELVQSNEFQRNLDRREFFPKSLKVIDMTCSGTSRPLTFDFVSDTGDGGDATFAVATGVFASTPELANAAKAPEPCRIVRWIRAAESQRATGLAPGGSADEGHDVLVLGGDLAYPGAHPDEYQTRLVEPFNAAHSLAGEPRKVVLAIPQNHDWFDSASTFCRYFVDQEARSFIDAETLQKQTYFAARLSSRWWLLGLDFASTSDIDRRQYEAFVRLLGTGDEGPYIQPGDDVILVVPRPYWTDSIEEQSDGGYPRRHQRLEGLIEQRGARIRLRLAGDLHHYVREIAVLPDESITDGRREAAPARPHDEFGPDDRVLVTCGAGGAFLHPTHTIEVAARKEFRSPKTSRPVSSGTKAELQAPIAIAPALGFPDKNPVRRSWPDPQTTRRMCLQSPLALFRVRYRRGGTRHSLRDRLRDMADSNLAFTLALGILYATVGSLLRPLVGPDAAAPQSPTPSPWLCGSPMVTIAVGLSLLYGCSRFAKEGPTGWLARSVEGALHATAHAIGIIATWTLAHALVQPMKIPALFDDAAFALGCIVIGSPIGGLVFGSYLAITCGWLGRMTNSGFSVLSYDGFKGFLRIRIVNEEVHATMFGIEDVPRTRLPFGDRLRGWKVVDHFLLRRCAHDR